MSLTLRTDLGRTEVIIADDGSLKTFYHVAGVLNETLKIKFLNKEDEFDSINWEFKFQGQYLTLHYNIYNGIIVFPTKENTSATKDNKAIVDLANALEGKLFIQERTKIVA